MENKGLVVVVCGPSQFGKDTVAEQLINKLNSSYKIRSSFATSYIVRERRLTDADHIQCFGTREQIPVAEDDRFEVTMYGNQSVIYDKKEIQDKVDAGDIVFIATGSTELAKTLKRKFDKQCFSVYIKAEEQSEKDMVKVDLERYYGSSDNPTGEQVEASRARVQKRRECIEKLKPAYDEFVQDEELGPDYVFDNWYHFLQKKSYMRNFSREEFDDLSFAVTESYRYINEGKDWSEKFSLSKEEREKCRGDLFDSWRDYGTRVRSIKSDDWL